VKEGTYLENINYKGKAITVASEFLLDGDTSHISKTIIDGSQPADSAMGSCVHFITQETKESKLIGFTLTGGIGRFNEQFFSRGGGGVMISYAGATVHHNRIINNHVVNVFFSNGGGISAAAIFSPLVPEVDIQYNYIANNSATAFAPSPNGVGGFGGGVFFHTIKGIFANNIVMNNQCASIPSDTTTGAGLVVEFAGELVVDRNVVANNTCGTGKSFGGGVANWKSATTYTNNIIYNNYANYGGGMFYDDTTSPVKVIRLINNSLNANTSDSGGSALYGQKRGAAEIMNTILWSGTEDRADLITMIQDAEVTIMYSNIAGGWAGETNIDVNPYFQDEMHHLSAMSQCVDQGADSADFNGTWLYAPETDMDGEDRPHPGTEVDIGADESPFFLGIADNNLINESNLIRQVYPNPFTTQLSISLDLPIQSEVVIKIYDLLGKQIAIVMDSNMDAGKHLITWNSDSLPEGIYYLRLTSGDKKETMKIVAVK
jgi:hypothetical protein